MSRQRWTVAHQQSGSLDNAVSPATVFFAILYVLTAMHASQSSKHSDGQESKTKENYLDRDT